MVTPMCRDGDAGKAQGAGGFTVSRIGLEPVLERIEVREPRQVEELQRHRGTEKFQPVTGRCKSLGDRDDF